jgi:hypothetical protein
MIENKVSGMDKILEQKPLVKDRVGKPKKSSSVEQALAQLESLSFEEQHESWWRVLLYWIRELRWRRIFWENMRRSATEEFIK